MTCGMQEAAAPYYVGLFEVSAEGFTQLLLSLGHFKNFQILSHV